MIKSINMLLRMSLTVRNGASNRPDLVKSQVLIIIVNFSQYKRLTSCGAYTSHDPLSSCSVSGKETLGGAAGDKGVTFKIGTHPV